MRSLLSKAIVTLREWVGEAIDAEVRDSLCVCDLRVRKVQ
jgi:hypothetical protein